MYQHKLLVREERERESEVAALHCYYLVKEGRDVRFT